MGFTAKKGELPQRTLPLDVCAICASPLKSTTIPKKKLQNIQNSSLSTAQNLISNIADAMSPSSHDPASSSYTYLINSHQNSQTVSIEKQEKFHTLSCGHQFHDFCLRGWTLIGKRDTCPNCCEKVQFQDSNKYPWGRTTKTWTWLLDMVRFFVVFNPIILLFTQKVLSWVY
jgi:hypothetical protein